MTEPSQLRVDGGEEARRNDRGLTQVQRRILATIRENGFIRSVEAGNYVHEASRRHARRLGALDEHRGKGCCSYAATDGLDAMKRLVKRGLVVKESRGHWVLVP